MTVASDMPRHIVSTKKSSPTFSYNFMGRPERRNEKHFGLQREESSLFMIKFNWRKIPLKIDKFQKLLSGASLRRGAEGWRNNKISFQDKIMKSGKIRNYSYLSSIVSTRVPERIGCGDSSACQGTTGRPSRLYDFRKTGSRRSEGTE